MKTVQIGKSKIGASNPVYVVAELSANHNRDFDLSVRTIKAMKESGADAVKVQTFNGASLTIKSDKEYFKISGGTLWDGATLYDLYESAFMPWEWHEPLKKLAEDLGMDFFSTPTDPVTADFLEKLNMPAYKIASLEITDTGLVEHVARKGKPIILSTGISGDEEISDALQACRRAGNDQVILLKCTSAYPTPWNDVNLRAIPEIHKKYGTWVGLSDHTMGDIVPLGAVSLGARVVEKHFILERSLGGPDSSFSMEPAEFKLMVDRIRILEQTLGDGAIEVPHTVSGSQKYGRSLFVVEDIKTGELFSAKNVRAIRPGIGMKPKFLEHIIGKKATKDIERGTPLSEDLIQNYR